MPRSDLNRRLRVVPPTLEPDQAFLHVLAGLGAQSSPVIHRTTRTAALRVLVATAATVAIATAALAAGTSDGEPPLSPAMSPTQLQTTAPPSPGEVGTPQSDRTTPPGSPAPPGLPGTRIFPRGHGATPRADDPKARPGVGNQFRGRVLPNSDGAPGPAPGRTPTGPQGNPGKADDDNRSRGKDRAHHGDRRARSDRADRRGQRDPKPRRGHRGEW